MQLAQVSHPALYKDYSGGSRNCSQLVPVLVRISERWRQAALAEEGCSAILGLAGHPSSECWHPVSQDYISLLFLYVGSAVPPLTCRHCIDENRCVFNASEGRRVKKWTIHVGWLTQHEVQQPLCKASLYSLWRLKANRLVSFFPLKKGARLSTFALFP